MFTCRAGSTQQRTPDGDWEIIIAPPRAVVSAPGYAGDVEFDLGIDTG